MIRAMKCEVLAKFVCHNLSCLIHAMEEFGIDPSFRLHKNSGTCTKSQSDLGLLVQSLIVGSGQKLEGKTGRAPLTVVRLPTTFGQRQEIDIRR